MAVAVDPFQTALLASRERYNTLYALAKRARPRLESERFKHNLLTFCAPLIQETQPVHRERITDALYTQALELTGVELFSRSDAVRAVWAELLCSAPSLVAEDPERVIPSLTNAAYQLEMEPGVDWCFWFRRMKELASLVESAGQWLSVAQVLAWVSGMAHYRSSAMALTETLPSELVEKVIPRWDKVKHDPWWPRRPEPGCMAKVHRVGGFAGFGGPFRRPPEVVTAGENTFLVSDLADDWVLFCDGFGATLKRVADFQPQEVASQDMRVNSSGEVLWSGERAFLPEAAPVGSFDVSGQVLAVTGRLSHYIYILLGTPEE